MHHRSGLSGPSQPGLRRAWCALALAVFAVGCRAGNPPLTPAPPTHATLLRTATSASSVYADCGWTVGVRAEVDLNGNGKHDAGEPPLPGVVFKLLNVPVLSLPATTDWSGTAGLGVFGPGCAGERYRVAVASFPEGFTQTTPYSVAASNGDHVYFGFQQLPRRPTITPRPPPARCERARMPEWWADPAVTSLFAAPDGGLWAGTRGGALRYDPGTADLLSGPTQTELVGTPVYSILAGPQDTLWFGTDRGIAWLAAGQPIEWTTRSGLGESLVHDLAITADGTVWAATESGVSRLATGEATWTTYAVRDGLPAGAVDHLHVAPDGRVWAAVRFVRGSPDRSLAVFSGDEHGQPWQPYDASLSGFAGWIEELTTGPDGALWMATFSGPLRFDLATARPEFPFEDRVDGPGRAPLTSLAFDASGTLWVGVYGDRAFQQAGDLWIPMTDFEAPDYLKIMPLSHGTVWVGASDGLRRCRMPSG